MASAFEPFGPYLLVRRLGGTAGCGALRVETFLALRAGDASGRALVVKRPRLGESVAGAAARSVAREAELLEAARGDGVAELESAGTLAGLPYVATVHAPGVTLHELIGNGGASALERVASLTLARDLAHALCGLHRKGIVHGDVAPANIVVRDDGTLQLVDFGAASREGKVCEFAVGTPGYAAPEVPSAAVSRASSDAYGFGVVVAEILGATRLFIETELAEAAARSEPSAARLAPLAELGLGQLLARDPDSRPSLAEAEEKLKEALAACTAGGRARAREEIAAAVERVLSSAPDGTLETPPRQSTRGGGARVSEAAQMPEPNLTPTVPMVAGLSPATAPVRAELPLEGAPRSRSALPRLVLAVGLGVAFASGVVVGRVGGRARGSSVWLAAPLPKRSHIEIDGRPALGSVGVSSSVAPGRHTIAVVSPRGERREHAVHLRPGSELVVLPIARGAGQARGTSPAGGTSAQAGADDHEAQEDR